MATRRPNMPRVRPAGNGSAEQDNATGGSADTSGRDANRSTPAAVNRSKVVPLGAAPGHQDDTPAAPTARRAPRQPDGGTPAATKPAAPKPAAKKPAAKKPAAGARRPVARPGKRPSTPHEKRLRERAELSGAIRSGSGSGARPPAAGQGPAGDAAPVPARAFSGRMLALAVILAVVTVLLLPSVGTYMNQRAEIAQLQSSIAEKQQEQDNLKTQIKRWDDPAYVKAQARNRINLVMPGEKKYMVVGATGDDSAVGPRSVGDVRTDLPWVDSLWDTVVRSATD
ncbi:FtsB family cell division protein [Arthrobacter sp.]|uniref:FtsB family cell division protein n=1 Tax=Arthrobacter sp. TaxID=1667 RepID=UPI003A95A97C